MSKSTASYLFETLSGVFRKSLAWRLREVESYCSSLKPACRIDKDVICAVHVGIDSTYFSASVITNSRLGDITGRYVFFTSPNFPDEDAALTHLTYQVALAAIRHPDIKFHRYYDEMTTFACGEWYIDNTPSSRKLNIITNDIE